MKRVLTVGGATQDLFVLCDPQDIASMSKIEVAQLHRSIGGGAANAAISFARWGNNVTLCGRVGMDTEGEWIASELQREAIQRALAQDMHEPTGSSYIIPFSHDAWKILVHRGANAALERGDLPHHYTEYDIVYVTTLTGKAAEILPELIFSAHRDEAFVACNPGIFQIMHHGDTIHTILPSLDALIVNTTEAKLLYEQITGNTLPSEKSDSIDSWNAYFSTFHAYGIPYLLVTEGALGAYLSTHTEQFFHPSIAKDIMSTVGAGDALGSTVIAALLDGVAPGQALMYGSINSAAVIAQIGATAGLLNKTEIEKRYQKVGDAKLKKFHPKK